MSKTISENSVQCIQRRDQQGWVAGEHAWNCAAGATIADPLDSPAECDPRVGLVAFGV